jgi:branched-chain amino acid transport system substrate-binding protein
MKNRKRCFKRLVQLGYLPMMNRRLLSLVWLVVAGLVRAEQSPVLIGIDAEFGLPGSISAQAIERGARVAVDEINRGGGVLGGRKLEIVTTDNRSVPARAEANIAELATRPNLVAVMCGRFSTAMLDALPMVHDKQLILLDPWAAADEITINALRPNYAFRVSMRDGFAMPVMMRYARSKGALRVGILSMNNSWGRSNVLAAERFWKQSGRPRIVAEEWFNFGDRSFVEQYMRLRTAGAQAILLVPLEKEGAAFVRELAALPAAQRLPIIATWGATGGKFVEEAGEDLFKIDFSVVQTFSFDRGDPARVASFMATYTRLYGAAVPAQIEAPNGVAQAYDLIHILARGIDLAGTTDRPAVRDALERVRGYRGLVRNYPEPFSPGRHDALTEADVFMAVYRRDGSLQPVSSGRGKP